MNATLRRFFLTCAPAFLTLPLVGACTDDPTGPSALRLVTLGASTDTIWAGAPGEPIPTGVSIRINNSNTGQPIAGATVTWEAIGRNAVALGSARSDAKGFATGVWQLGTDASALQQLRVLVRSGQHNRELVLRARAVPHVVAQVRVSIDSPAVVRVGDSLPIVVTATDPYGNTFRPALPLLSLSDTSVGAIIGSVLIAGPKRGTAELSITSNYVAMRVPVRVVQYVASIVPENDAVSFTSLGAAVPVRYTVRDDRGRVVADTAAQMQVMDTTVAQLSDSLVRSLATGSTQLQLVVGSVNRTIPIDVQQRIAALRLSQDTIRFDALQDTTTIYATATDSLGSPVVNPELIYELSDGRVVSLDSASVLKALTPGMAMLILRDAVTGVSVDAAVLVEQRVASIDLSPIVFDALGDTISISAVARDRLGSTIDEAKLVYLISDGTVASFDSEELLRSSAEGQVILTALDPESGVTAAIEVIVAQRVASLTVSADTITFDALGDTATVGIVARDRLGAVVLSAVTSCSSNDERVATSSPDGAIRSLDNGTAMVVCGSLDGPADTLMVGVAQRVASFRMVQDSLFFESLRAVQGIAATPLDRLGSPVTTEPVTFSSSDTSIVTVDETGHVTAVGNGSGSVQVLSGGITRVVSLHVQQRPVRVAFPADTIRFSALGDSATLTGVAVDSLGSTVSSEITGVSVLDTAVVVAANPIVVRASGNGTTAASVAIGGIVGQLTIIVDQVPASLTVSSTFGSPVIMLSAGAPAPLLCQALDRNGYPVALDPILLGSRKGTVTGSRCADARIARSGYDTLVFAAESVQTSLGVIVATRPDSVSVLVAAQPLPSEDRIRFVGEDLSNPLVLALRPLVSEILASYGDPTASLDRARALRDWVARTAIHPYSGIHPYGSSSNLSVLPLGSTWADVNRIQTSVRAEADRNFWGGVGMDGFAMLNRLLGTLDLGSGQRADDGLMVHVEGARYRIRDVSTYHYVQCSYQDIILNALWAAAGLQGMLISTVGHDPAAVFIPELSRWIYEDPTFNEEYVLDSSVEPLSPTELLEWSSSGNASRLHAVKHGGPSFDPEVYVAAASYISGDHSDGTRIMGSQLNNRVVGIGGWPLRYVQIDVPQLAAEPGFSDTIRYARVSPLGAFPILGVVVDTTELIDSVFVVRLSTTFPGSHRFERRLRGANWETVSSVDILPVGECRVEYRSVDVQGNVSAIASMDVWAPRTRSFVDSALPGSLREQASFCT